MRTHLENGTWVNEPANWEVSADRLTMTTDQKTDFWQKTHYGFERDSGHFLGVPIPV
ncbi:regulation of enolase protein 1 (concanavalin A-like superfamily) [Rhizobium soli]|uniref:Regulation of enolase protein 1 (Concanavalin A-like superfamily) n=1 Tax=Rhizobium soli TaxID=424798 RepID=A0A7X0MUZ5_9HYPH|nr:regulation of enolase protein 1 (concanavalin A-like superfamily) [Rhizobium soli]